MRYGDKVTTIDRNTWPSLRRLLACSFFFPALDTDIPEGQRLHGGGLAGVVWTNQNDRVSQFKLCIIKALEIANCELGQHSERLLIISDGG